jgi:hypothetical protein
MSWLEVAVSKFYDWRQRYGRVNEHNGWAPRNFWLVQWEKAAIIDFQGSIPPFCWFGARFYFSKRKKLTTVTGHPRLFARAAGVFYLIIIVFALFAYKYVRGQLIVPGDMAQTEANTLAHERLYLGLLMMVAGLTHGINNFGRFLALKILYIQWVTLIAELSLALWLLVVGVKEAKWRAQAGTA